MSEWRGFLEMSEYSDKDVENCARELIAKFGREAFEVAREKVAQLSSSTDRSELDFALQALSKIAEIMEANESTEMKH